MNSILDEDLVKRQSTGSLFSILPETKVLDTVQLAELERSFRAWSNDSRRQNVCRSRKRITLIFC